MTQPNNNRMLRLIGVAIIAASIVTFNIAAFALGVLLLIIGQITKS
jgi:hypothetical protein